MSSLAQVHLPDGALFAFLLYYHVALLSLLCATSCGSAVLAPVYALLRYISEFRMAASASSRMHSALKLLPRSGLLQEVGEQIASRHIPKVFLVNDSHDRETTAMPSVLGNLCLLLQPAPLAWTACLPNFHMMAPHGMNIQAELCRAAGTAQGPRPTGYSCTLSRRPLHQRRHQQLGLHLPHLNVTLHVLQAGTIKHTADTAQQWYPQQQQQPVYPLTAS